MNFRNKGHELQGWRSRTSGMEVMNFRNKGHELQGCNFSGEGDELQAQKS
jgi:hypothetical protein